jgi:hypothetical protein
MKRAIQALFFAIGTSAAVLTIPSPRSSEACGNPIVFATDETVRALKQADEMLNDGKPAEAAALVQKKIKNLAEGYPVPGDKSKSALLVNRGLRILALASVRLDGEFGPWNKDKAGERTLNVKWSTRVLKGLYEIKAGDAGSKTDYAEALAKTSATEAKGLLEDLAQKDLVTTPYGYAALAALRAAAGDAKGRDEAIARCTTMAAKKTICDLPKPKPNG